MRLLIVPFCGATMVEAYTTFWYVVLRFVMACEIAAAAAANERFY